MKRKTEGSGRDWMYKGGRREERLKMKWKGRKDVGGGGGRREWKRRGNEMGTRGLRREGEMQAEGKGRTENKETGRTGEMGTEGKGSKENGKGREGKRKETEGKRQEKEGNRIGRT